MEVMALSLQISWEARGAESGEEQSVAGRPRIALVLSGGAARGAAHVGVDVGAPLYTREECLSKTERPTQRLRPSGL